MSTVTFDAPQCIGDEVLDDEPAEDGSIRVFVPEDGESPQVVESTATPAAAESSIATEVSGDPIVSADEFRSQAESSEPTATVTPAALPLAADVAATASPDQPERSESDDALNQIWNAEQECRRKEAQVEMLKEQVKEAKSQLEQAVIRLRELCSEHAQSRSNSTTTTERIETVPVAAPTAMGESIVGMPPPGAATESASVEPEKPDNSWRDVSITVLFNPPIPRFGEKKQSRLIEACPTLGAFEDVRSRVGIDAFELHVLLPDRIGPDDASELEERFLTWLANHTSGRPVETDASTITKRASEINDGSKNSLDFKHPEGKQWHDSGWEAYGRQVKLEECPYIPGPEQDDWIRGWLGHQVIDRYDQNTEPVGVEAMADAAEAAGESIEPEDKLTSLMGQAVSLADL